MSRWRAAAAGRVADSVPDWLVETVRPQRVPVPWGGMLAALIAITTPLGLGVATVATDDLGSFVVVAMGAMAGVFGDPGGPYATRAGRIAAAGAGGAAGFAVGAAVRGHGTTVVLAMVLVSVLAALLSAAGGSGSIMGLYLLVYAAVGTGPIGAERPGPGAALFFAGSAWAFVVSLAAWPVRPLAIEESAVAEVYRSLVVLLSRLGDDTGRPGVTRPGDGPAAAWSRCSTAINQAFDMLLAERAAAAGGDTRRRRLIALLTRATVVRDAVLALEYEDPSPRPAAASALTAVADAITTRRPARERPPIDGGTSPGSRALAAAVDGAVALVGPAGGTPAAVAPVAPVGPARPESTVRRLTRTTFARRVHDVLVSPADRVIRLYALRLAACMAVAAIVSQSLDLERSYWVMLTVGIVLKPDFGSVFARALQRGLGTVVGAVIGAALIVAVPYGSLLLIPIGACAFVLPYAKRRNWGMFTTFQAPLVIMLVDLATNQRWDLVRARLVDTLLGCAIVVLLGYLPWPGTWHAALPPQLAEALRATATFAEVEFERRAGDRGEARHRAYRSLNRLEQTFQRVVSEPRRVSGPVTVWWPAVVALRQVDDALAAIAAAARHGAPLPAPQDVRSATAELAVLAVGVERRTAATGEPPALHEPGTDVFAPVVAALRSLRQAIARAEEPVRL